MPRPLFGPAPTVHHTLTEESQMGTRIKLNQAVIYVILPYVLQLVPALMTSGKTVMLALSPRNMERFQYDDCVVRMRMWPVVGVAVAGAVFAGELIAIIAGVEQYVYWGAGLMALEAAIALLCLFYIRVYDRYPCVQIDANAAAAEDKTA